MLRALEADVGNRGAFQRRKQDPPQRITDGGAETAFKRLSGKSAKCIGRNLLIARDARRQFQSTPTNSHVGLLVARRIAGSSRPDRSGPSVLPPRRGTTIEIDVTSAPCLAPAATRGSLANYPAWPRGLNGRLHTSLL